MNKKILTCILSLGVLVGLAGCGSSGGSTDSGFSDRVLADTTEGVYGWGIHGPHLLADGTQNDWNGKDPELYKKSLMTAASLKDVSEVSVEVATALKAKSPKAVYMYEGIQLGVNDAGYTKTYLDPKDNKQYVVNGSYTFKACKFNYIAPEEEGDPEVYGEEQWIPHDNDGRTEALTDNIWTGPWQEDPDEYGYSWNYDPILMRGQGGKYTLIAAEYPSSTDSPRFGLALVLIEANPAALPATEYVPPEPPAETTYSIIGAFGGYSWNTDVDMTKSGNVYTVTQEFAANDEFKVRMNHEWDPPTGGNWGFDVVDTANSTTHIETNGGNIKVTANGTYVVTFDPSGDSPVITVTEAVA